MTTEQILAGLPSLRALVVGDICLDRWCTYDPKLADPSRETGLDRFAVTKVECTPGGGGSVAANLAALGVSRAAVLGVAGTDGHSSELIRALEGSGIDASGMICSPDLCTFTYSKLINAETGIEDVPRVDFVQAAALPEAIESGIIERLWEWQSKFDVIFAADQAETSTGGVITKPVRNALAEIARRNPARIVWADSRVRAELFRNVTVKINRSEAEDACLRAFGAVDYGRLRAHLETERLFVTDGSNGVHVGDGEAVYWVPARRIENPVDICGAGDSFSASAGCALAVGATAEEAAAFGHLAASITVMKRGTGTASAEELKAAGVLA